MKKMTIIVTILSMLLMMGCSNNEKLKDDTSVVVKDTIADENNTLEEDNNTDIVEDITIKETEEHTEDNGDDDSGYAREANYEKRVVCWGTSLTEGSGGNGVTMPNVLERLSGATVLNYGGYAENTNCIATRSGASTFSILSDFVIPSDDSSVEVSFVTEFGDIEEILKYTDAGLNPVTIDGIEGNLACDEKGNYFFSRLETGEEKQVISGTVIVPYSVYDKRADDINVIWTAGNDNLESTEDIQHLIEKIDKMIEFSGSDKYVVLSEMNKHSVVPVTDEVNIMLEEHYGANFLNFRKYLIEDALNDLHLSPSTEDSWDMSVYEVPAYLLSGEVHGNSLYYYLAGQQVYKKCQELGYLY